MLRQRFGAETFGGMVASSQIGDTGFPRKMHGLLGYLSADIGVDTEGDGLLEIALSTARTPGNAPDGARGVTDQLRYTAELCSNRLRQLTRRHRRSRTPDPGNILLAETRFGDPAQARCKLRIVAKLGMGVEG